MNDTTLTIPLFPLGTVLFPGCPLSLHIFEERYRLMISNCLDQRQPFGVVLIREGDEVVEGRLGGQAAEPCTIGTIAHIRTSMRLDDGRFLITTTGQQRFQIDQIVQRTPYLIARVELLPERHTPGVDLVARELRLLYTRYWQGIAAATGAEVEVEDLPNDVDLLSYTLADRLQVEMGQKQAWLEAEVGPRLREMSKLLRNELMLLPPTEPGLNGGGSLN